MTDAIMTKMGFTPEGSNYRHTATGGLVKFNHTRKRPWTAAGADGLHVKDDAGLVRGFMTPHACATAALKHWGIG